MLQKLRVQHLQQWAQNGSELIRAAAGALQRVRKRPAMENLAGRSVLPKCHTV